MTDDLLSSEQLTRPVTDPELRAVLRAATVNPPKLKPAAVPETQNEPKTAIQAAVEGILNDLGFLESLPPLSALPPDQRESGYFQALSALSPGQYDRAFDTAWALIRRGYTSRPYALLDEFNRRVKELLNPELSSTPAKTSGSVEPPEAQDHEQPQMRENDKKVFIKDGVRYRPLPLAAQMAQAPRQTVLNWIKNQTEFEGQPLQSYYFAPLDSYFVSEESIQKMAARFVEWPSEKPAGPVTIGETKDKSGFLSTSAAARIIGVSPRTVWLWAKEEKAPTDKPLNVVKCTTSDHFYIQERDVYDLKKLVPRSGLQRGRRPLTIQPS